MKSPTKIHLLTIIVILLLFIVFIVYRLWVLSEAVDTTLSRTEQASIPPPVIVKGVTIPTPAINTGINKNGIHGMCMYYDNKNTPNLILCDYNNSKIYVYSEQKSSTDEKVKVWKEGQTLDVESIAPNPTGVCVTSDGKRLIIVSRGKSNVCMSIMDENGLYGIPRSIYPKIEWPISPSMTSDGSVLIVPQRNGPSIYCGRWNGTDYDFKPLTMLGIPIRTYFGSSIKVKNGKIKIAYTASNNNKAYVANLDEYGISNEKEIPGIVPGDIRAVQFSKIDDNLLFVTNMSDSATNIQYSVFKKGIGVDNGLDWNWDTLTSIPGDKIPSKFNNTGFVIGENNMVYISQYTAPSESYGIHKFQYDVQYDNIS